MTSSTVPTLSNLVNRIRFGVSPVYFLRLFYQHAIKAVFDCYNIFVTSFDIQNKGLNICDTICTFASDFVTHEEVFVAVD